MPPRVGCPPEALADLKLVSTCEVNSPVSVSHWSSARRCEGSCGRRVKGNMPLNFRFVDLEQNGLQDNALGHCHWIYLEIL